MKLLKILIIFFFLQFPLFSIAHNNNIEILILLDASVSMLETFDNQPKYILATNAIKNVLNNYSLKDKIGLRTIGLSIDENLIEIMNNPSFLCKATQLVSPIKSNNISEISTKLDSVFPLGTTPLTFSLRTAIDNDFSSNTYKHIILITDGGENCDENPCGYIQSVMKSRNDIKIDVILIGENNSDYNQLKCLSDSTNGKIFNIKSSNEFNSSLKNILNDNFKINKVKDQIKDIDYNINSESIILKNFLLEIDE